MNATEVYNPSDSIVDSGLGFTIIFSVLSPLFVGAVVLPVLLLKSLRSQPYQFLVSNYLTSLLANVLGSGLYRAVQIIKYKSEGYEATARDTNCIVTSFSQFPVVVSNYCLFLIGLERFIFLRSKPRMPIDWCSLFVFVIIPWAIGITRYSTYLGDSSSRYRNIPYLGICVDITSERDGRRIVHFIFDIVIPVLLNIIVLSVDYGKAYSYYKLIQAKLSYNRGEERLDLIEKKKNVMTVVRDLNIVFVFFALRVIATIVITSLFREYSKQENSQQQKDAAATAAMIVLLCEPCVIPVIFALVNTEVRRETLRYFQSVQVFPFTIKQATQSTEQSTSEAGPS